MIRGYRPVLLTALLAVMLVLLGVGPNAGGDAESEMSLASAQAEQGGFAAQCALRMMLWTEPAEAGSFVLQNPSPSEQAHLTEADARAKAALATQPDLLPALILLGRLSWIGGRVNDATNYFQRALSYAPDSGQALLGLTDLHLDRREREKAQTTLASIRMADSSTAGEIGLRQGTLAAWRGDGAGATAALAAAAEPPGGEGLLPYLWVLAKGYALAGQPGNAAALLTREVPVWARPLWAELAGLLAQATESGEAGLAELDRAGNALPSYPWPRWEKSLVLLERGDPAGAASLLAEPVNPGASKAGLLFLLGTAREEARDLAGAARAYNDLVALRPRLGLGYYGLGRVSFLNKRYSDALRYLGQGIKVSSKLPCLYLQRAEVYDQLKMKKQAAADRKSAAAIAPSAEIGGWRVQMQAAKGLNPSVAALVGLAGREAPPRGLFLSRDGRRWRWYPWHGAPVALAGSVSGQKIQVQPDLTDSNGALMSGTIPLPPPRDTRPPVLVRPCTVARAADGVLYASWQTDEPARAEIRVWPRGGQESTAGRIPSGEYSQWFRVSLTDLLPGDYLMRVNLFDAAGNPAGSEPVSFRVDQPAGSLTGTLAINGGAAYANNRRVTLNFTLTGENQGATVRVANEDGQFTAWQALTAVTSWDLSPGDGVKTVSAQFRRGFAYSSVLTASTTLDTRPPVIFGVLVPTTGETSATLTWKTDEPAESRVDLQQGQSWATAFLGSGFMTDHTATLYGLQRGTRYAVRINATDRAGNISQVTQTDLLTITAPDQQPPTGRLQINRGARFTNSIYVTLEIEGSDAGSAMREMSFSNDGLVWSMPEIYTPTKLWRLTPGDGPKTVYLRLTDLAGNISAPIMAQIDLDTTPPTIYGVTSQVQTDGRITISWQTDEFTNGLVQYGQSPNFATPDPRELTSILARDHVATLPPLPPGAVYFRVVARDQAENIALGQATSLLVPGRDSVGPAGGLSINGGEPYTRETQVTLAIWAQDQSGVVSMQLRNGSGFSFWSAWETFTYRRSWTLSGGDGEKEIQVRFRDSSGNVSPIYSARIYLDTRTPVIQDLTCVPTGSRSVAVRWRTDEPTVGTLYYRRAAGGPEYYLDENRQGGLSNEHEIVAANLEPGVAYRARLVAMDRAGNRTEGTGFDLTTVASDQIPPTGTIRINNGAGTTNNPQVTLSLSASDQGGAVVSMSFSNDGRNWSPDEPYQTTRIYNLPGGDGLKTIYVRFRDRVGNYSAPISDGITLDTRPPTIMNIGTTPIPPDAVEISWRTDEPTYGLVRFGTIMRSYAERGEENRGLFTQDGGYGYEHRVRLARLLAGRTYYAVIEAVDRAENRGTSAEFNFALELPDQIPPTGTIRINNGAGTTNNPQVTLSLSATDPGGTVVSMSFSNDGHNWSPDEPYQTTRIYNLPGGNGQKTVYVRYRDQAGNYSAPISDSIMLFIGPPPDQTPPTGTIRINNGAGTTNNPQVTLSLSASDPGGTVVSMSFSNDGQYWSPDEPYQTTRIYNLPGGNGQKTVYVRYRDQAGNYSAPASDSIMLFIGPPPDQTPPTGTIRINNGAGTTNNPQVTLSLSASDPGGTVVSMSFSNDGHNWSPDEPYQTTRTYTLPGGNGQKTVYVRYRDQAGNYSAPISDSIMLFIGPPPDQVPPTGTIRINNGAGTTNNPQVTLSLSASDPGGTVVSMSFSNDGHNWSPDEPYQTTRTYTLPGGNGQKTVYVRYRDQAGNYSAPASDSIMLFIGPPPDQTPPTGTIRINNGAGTTNNPQVTLSLSASDPGGTVVSMSFSNDGHNWSPDEPYQTTRTYTLPGGNGQKTVYVRYRDQAGNYSAPASDSIMLFIGPPPDQTPPTGTIRINNGAGTTNNPQVTLSLSASDPGGTVVSMSFSNDGHNWSPDEPYQTTRTYTLPGGNGQKTVYVRYRDQAGNYSAPASDSIMLFIGPPPDQVPPTGTIRINNGAGTTNNPQVTLSLSASDPGGTVVSMSFSNDGQNWSPDEPYQTTRTYTLPGGNGQKAVYVRYRDQAGNYSAPISDSITLLMPPQPPGGGTNVALAANGGKAGASSRKGEGGSDPGLAIDGNYNTFWTPPNVPRSSRADQEDSFFTWSLDLKQAYRVASLRLTIANPGRFTIMLKKNGKWTEAYKDFADRPAQYTKANNNGVLTLEFTVGAEIEGVRLVWTAQPRTGDVSLYEVEAVVAVS